jgi:hypothetical protein
MPMTDQAMVVLHEMDTEGNQQRTDIEGDEED